MAEEQGVTKNSPLGNPMYDTPRELVKLENKDISPDLSNRTKRIYQSLDIGWKQ